MNGHYQRCLSAGKRLYSSLNMAHSSDTTSDIEISSVSATSLLYHYAISAVCTVLHSDSVLLSADTRCYKNVAQLMLQR